MHCTTRLHRNTDDMSVKIVPIFHHVIRCRTEGIVVHYNLLRRLQRHLKWIRALHTYQSDTCPPGHICCPIAAGLDLPCTHSQGNSRNRTSRVSGSYRLAGTPCTPWIPRRRCGRHLAVALQWHQHCEQHQPVKLRGWRLDKCLSFYWIFDIPGSGT